MTEFVFTSPGVKFKERDLTYVTRNVGITTLGLAGETLKGPAFEPFYIKDRPQFLDKFGAQDTSKYSNGNLRYQLPYVANAYLQESDQLWVTRVLGLSGYDAGSAWTISLNAGVDPSTIVSGTTSDGSREFTDNTFFGTPVYTVGQEGAAFSGFIKNEDGVSFIGSYYTFTVTSISGGTGNVDYVETPLTGTPYVQYQDMVLAVLRSKATVTDNVDAPSVTTFTVNAIDFDSNLTNDGTGDLFREFTLYVSLSDGGTATYNVSMNPNASNFIANVLGTTPTAKQSHIWVEAVYPDLISKLDVDGDAFTPETMLSGIASYAFGISNNIIKNTDGIFVNRKEKFKTPETPWVVSQLKGNIVDRLFKFVSISDGDDANQEIKVSIVNINPETLEFDVIIRSFYDTDANMNILESFTRCSLIQSKTNFIGQRIGTTDDNYELLSKYVMVELAADIKPESFPAGFEGYWFNTFKTAVTPKIFYKTSYAYTDKIAKTSLGISNTAYNTANSVGIGVNQNFFNYNGWKNSESNPTGFTKTKGFHMDVDASIVLADNLDPLEFEVGISSFKSIQDVLLPSNAYNSIKTRKFTIAFSGGFDGWDINRTNRTHTDLYREGGIYDGVGAGVTPANDYQAWETAINTFSNPEKITINLFATPAINWSDNTTLVTKTIEMIEEQRTDSLYIIDAPNIDIAMSIGDNNNTDVVASNDIVDLLNSTDIDSSYACTYFPFIQVKDTQNNVNVYIPPTGEVAKAIAYTDTKKFPWYAPAGLERGVTDARRSKYKLSQEARDVLYKGRINPMVDFSNTGTAIFGQKTLQVRESALDRINVRRLLLQIKVLISNIAMRLIFEQNDQATIDQFKQKTNPILDGIKRDRGLLEFKVVMDDTINTPETLDRNELYGEIYLKPTRSLEKIGIGFTIAPSGASFSEI
jgi:hypothetical protein